MKFLITGGNGLLANEFSKNVFFSYGSICSRQQLNITETKNSLPIIRKTSPDIIINCAAYTNVTKSECEQNTANKVNGFSLSDFSKICNDFGIWLIHFSTDYVFDGKKDYYTETDSPNPINAYGRSKLIGEENIEAFCKNYTIIRVSWLYGASGLNFFSIIHRLLSEKKQLYIVDDQFGKTTYAQDVCTATKNIIQNGLKGVYHFSNEGSCSRYEFAVYIKELLNSKCEVIPVSSSHYPDPTPRPERTLLNTSKYKNDTKKQIPHWQESVSNFLKNF